MLPLEQYKQELCNVLSTSDVIKKLYLFGSAITPRFNDATSDIDVLIETEDLPPEQKGEQLIALWENLEKLFNRKVDLLTENALHNPFLIKEINKTRKLIYNGQNKQIFI
jgi:predicted nucleotidyltransferase